MDRHSNWGSVGGRSWRRAALALLLLVATGCGGGEAPGRPATSPTGTGATSAGVSATPTATTVAGPSPATGPSAPGGTPPTATPGATATTAAPARAATAATPAAVAFQVETVAEGLDTPWELAFAPDGRIFFTERPGRLRVIEGGRLRPEPVATISEVVERGEGGLLGLALGPDFANNGDLYLYHTSNDRSGGLRNRVVRYTLADRAGARGLTDPRVILDDIPASAIHNGGRIAFGPDGKLYVTTGDAAAPALAQDRDSLAGKILRLNPDGSVPDDNPFPGSPVYSYGHRNPQGLAWQPGTGQLYATEHGPSAHDEVNRIEAGANYGWPAMRGSEGGREGFTAPVIASGADATWAPSGAIFVGADTFPQWRGDLLFAGLRSTTLWRLDLRPDGAGQLDPLLDDEYGRLRTVAEGPDGSLYVLTSSRDGRGNPSPGDDRVLRLRSR